MKVHMQAVCEWARCARTRAQPDLATARRKWQDNTLRWISISHHLPFELDTRDHKHNTPNTATRARPRGPINRPFSPPLRYNSRPAPLLFSTVDKSLEASPISPRHPWSSSRFQLCLGRALLVVGLALLVVGHTRLVIGCALVIIGRALVIIGCVLVIIGVALELI